MCGIAGIISTNGVRAADVAPMVDAQRHRGPDAHGAWADELCALGHRRLSVIDLSEASCQPLSTDTGRVVIVFNGEIYNYLDLRRELSQLGHRFRSGGDAEVIASAYEQWGTAAISRLRGMFAFAIWDRARRRLVLARDRVGKKPLFFARTDGTMLFASELQGLLASPLTPRGIDPHAIDAYLSWGYIPAPRTAFRAVSKIDPAHWMTVDVTDAGLTVTTERYWSLRYTPKKPVAIDAATSDVRRTLTDAVRARLISDVPLGAFLSGGIDSSIVVGLMASLSDRPVKTFSIGFDDARFNELEHARAVARRWKTDHHELVVRPDALSVLPTLVRHYGEPYADSSAIPTFYLARLARETVTVALSGDGGDESFAGYDRYRAMRDAARIAAIPGGRAAARVVSSLLPDSIDPRNRRRRAKRFLAAVGRPPWRRYARWLQYFTDEDKARLYHGDFLEHVDLNASQRWLESLAAADDADDDVDAAMRIDVQSYLPYDLLVKVDIASMANSLEVRSPFLDAEVMTTASALPVDLKLRGTTSKWILKQAFADLLDPAIARRPKMGFGVPVGEWLRGSLQELLRDALFTDRSFSHTHLRAAELRRLVDDHASARRDHTAQLWSLLMLELWYAGLATA